ncbi:sensor histidine kinase [Brachybacterium sp. AOP43-C2-M15]|uniref:sensor histidine kinase n=1 Tax=Brachybacterium sp. AOP43-C2-M15 TaxID=3457661 RepID=UPI004033A5C4
MSSAPRPAPADPDAPVDPDARADPPADPDAPAAPPVGPRDLLVAALYALVVVLLAASGVSNSGFLVESGSWSRTVSVALLLVACVSLIWRRRHPMITLAVAGPIGVAEIIGGGQISAYFLLFEALFDPVMHGSRRLALWTTRIAIATAAAAILLGLGLGLSGPLVFLIAMIATLVVMTPLLWGWEVRHHRDARQSAEQLADLEHELAAARADHAVETERRSIAHDLHDVIAGHLSAVSLHTNLASALEDPRDRDRSLATARDSAHAALRDLRSMIGVLSAEDAGAQPQVTLDWPSLTARLRGRDPEARVTIDPAVTDPARVEPSVQAALLRIGAEAATNAVRHGRAPITMDVQVGERAVMLALHNRRADDSLPGTGVGRGAIAHRATAVGGTATSGPAPADAPEAGTWRVRAELPARAVAAAPVEAEAEIAAGAGTSTRPPTGTDDTGTDDAAAAPAPVRSVPADHEARSTVPSTEEPCR